MASCSKEHVHQTPDSRFSERWWWCDDNPPSNPSDRGESLPSGSLRDTHISHTVTEHSAVTHTHARMRKTLMQHANILLRGILHHTHFWRTDDISVFVLVVQLRAEKNTVLFFFKTHLFLKTLFQWEVNTSNSRFLNQQSARNKMWFIVVYCKEQTWLNLTKCIYF